jgi:transmembrane sensor
MDERLWILLAKKKSGEASASELEELNALLKSEIIGEQGIDMLDKIWQSPLKPAGNDELHDHTWQNIEKHISDKPRLSRLVTSRFGRWVAAASIVIIAGVAIYMFRSANGPLPSARLNHVTTQAGSKSRVELPDGTELWLNGNSRITYKVEEFGRSLREVTLIGEAYFDVTANKDVPFIIHANSVNIRVTGTAFNVKAYPSSKVFETALVHGSIEITTVNNPERKIVLRPNEKFVMSLDSARPKQQALPVEEAPSFSSYSISKLNVLPGEGPVETVWMNSRLAFNDDRFDQLALKLEAWYNIRVQFADDELKEKRFTGAIERETLEQTLQVLQLSYPFEYQINGTQLTIRKR